MSEALSRLVRKNIIFSTYHGQLIPQDLWRLPLTSTTGKPNLNDIAKELHGKINDSEQNFVSSLSSGVDPDTKAAFDYVVEVIKFREAEAEASRARAARADKKQKILEAMAARENADLASKSVEELAGMLDDLASS